jgi:hypothetical protein
MIPEPVFCDRCGAEADAEWVDVSTYSRVDHVLGRSVCRTPGCVDEDGSPSVPPPDDPGHLTREDHRWIRAQQRLIDEYGRVARVLADATEGW